MADLPIRGAVPAGYFTGQQHITSGELAALLNQAAAPVQVFSGGGAPTAGLHLEAGAGSGGTAGALSVSTQAASPSAGRLALLAYNTTTGDVTTVMKVNVGGVPGADVTLGGAAGVVALDLAAVAAGDLLAVEHESGQVPGACQMQVYLV